VRGIHSCLQEDFERGSGQYQQELTTSMDQVLREFVDDYTDAQREWIATRRVDIKQCGVVEPVRGFPLLCDRLCTGADCCDEESKACAHVFVGTLI
jgi:hypothetical protein